ncbi:MAG: class I SAM-dependent methyltransferase [Geminicoccaceae bacterium]
MRLVVNDLRTFYASRQGQVARRLIVHEIKRACPDFPNGRVVGVGYAGPFLEAMREDAAEVFALMPQEQGAEPWLSDGRVAAALVDETNLPLGDNSADCVVLAHSLEASDRVNRLLREVWRILADGGRLLVLAPNRRGLWSFADTNPFGHGRPYSSTQLKQLLRANMFNPLRRARALYMPPSQSRLILRTAVAWERVGRRFARAFSGVLIIEAEKSLYAGTPLLVGAKKLKHRVYAPFKHPAGAQAAAYKTPAEPSGLATSLPLLKIKPPL